MLALIGNWSQELKGHPFNPSPIFNLCNIDPFSVYHKTDEWSDMVALFCKLCSQLGIKKDFGVIEASNYKPNASLIIYPAYPPRLYCVY